MDFDRLRQYCLSKPATSEHMPWGDDTLVFKVMDKVFAISGISQRPLSVNLKCDPQRAIELRDRYPAIQPGYHMNKQHWNTVMLDGSLDDSLVEELIDHSWTLVVKGLKKTDREALLNEAAKND